jgi:hypothetical protein
MSNEDEEDLIIRNFEFFESDDEEEVDNISEVNEKDNYDGYDTPDEDTEEFVEILQELLNDIAVVDVIGLKVYKIDFYDTKNIGELEDKKCKCDFDLRDDGYPIMPDGGEEFIAPYLLRVSKKFKFFKGCIFETNIGKKITI